MFKMMAQSARLVLILILLTCLGKGTSGEGAENKEVLVGPVNNLMEDAIKFNIVKKEAIPDRQKNEKRKKGRKNQALKRKGTKGKGKRKMQKKQIKNNKRNMNNKKGRGKEKKQMKQKRNNKRNRNNKKGRGKGKKQMKQKRNKKRNRNIKKEGIKRGKGGKRRYKKIQKRKIKDSKKRKMQKKQKRNRLGSKKTNKKNNIQRIPQCTTSPDDATELVSSKIFEYRKYVNHKRMIARAKKNIENMGKKSQAGKRVEYTDVAGYLKAVTTNGTACPGNNSLAPTVNETVTTLTVCAADTGPIVTTCQYNNGDTTDIDACSNVSPPGPYEQWINAMDNCFETDKTCKCYEDLSLVTIPNISPTSCEKPGNPPPDWIDAFEKGSKAALKACNVEVKKCKDAIKTAAKLEAQCCGKTAGTAADCDSVKQCLSSKVDECISAQGQVTTGATERRNVQHAKLKYGLKNKLFH